jgi:hypothetical protein
MDSDQEIVSIITFKMTPDSFDEITREIAETLKSRGPEISGFIESALLGNKAKTEAIIISAWRSRKAWAEAQWDAEVGRMVADVFKETVSYNLDLFYRLVNVQGRPEK